MLLGVSKMAGELDIQVVIVKMLMRRDIPGGAAQIQQDRFVRVDGRDCDIEFAGNLLRFQSLRKGLQDLELRRAGFFHHLGASTALLGL